MQKLLQPHPDDNEGYYRLLHIKETIVVQNRVILITDFLGISLYEYQKLKYQQSHKQMYSAIQIKLIAKQVFQALKFMKNKGVIHCDVKPDNILFTDDKFRNIKLIDFGSSCEHYKIGFSYVQSRMYRAPEIVF